MSKTLHYFLCSLFTLCSLLPQVILADEVENTTDQQWGNLSGQLIYDGDPPKPKLKMVAGKPPIMDESLLVHPESLGLANAFIYIRSEVKPEAVHRDWKLKPARIFGKDLGFSPHVLCVEAGQKLFLDNTKGKVALNVKGDPFKNGSFNYLIPPGQEFSHTLEKSEALPASLGCNIHPWFSAYVLIRDNPYMAITDANGKFEIKNLPPGEHEFQFWHEKTGFLKLPAIKLREAEVAGKPEKGRTLLNIQPGDNNLGEIKLDPNQF